MLKSIRAQVTINITLTVIFRNLPMLFPAIGFYYVDFALSNHLDLLIRHSQFFRFPISDKS